MEPPATVAAPSAEEGEVSAGRSPETVPEASLLDACRRGDRSAFHSLVERYQDRVFTLAMHLARNETLAREVAQQAFVKAFRALPGFRGDARFATWLHRIVVNAYRDEIRRSRRFVTLEESHPAPDDESPHAKAANGERRRLVREAVARLPLRLRVPLLLRYLEELSYEEIARVLRCRAGTVASRLHRGHRRLARELSALGSRPRPRDEAQP